MVEKHAKKLEAKEIFRQRPQQDTRVSLGPVFNHLPQLVDRPRRLLIRV